MSKRKVVIRQVRLAHYREPLFELLREYCSSDGIELTLIHGQPTRKERTKGDGGRLEWATAVNNLYLPIFGHDLVFQPGAPYEHDADLIVLQQENRILSNYVHLVRYRSGTTRLAFWGHGANFQSNRPQGVRERWKRWQCGLVDWWFAYTGMTVGLLEKTGFPAERITCLNNSFDTKAFRALIAAVKEEDKEALRRKIGARPDARIGLFCGALYREKRLDLLFEAAMRIRERIGKFHLVILGDGPERERVVHWQARHDWIHWQGHTTGLKKAMWFALADVMLNPGLVGLHVLDSFAAGLPMISTTEARHSPEISYLQPGVNGLLVGSSAEAYSDAVIALLKDRDRLSVIAREARAAGDRYTVEAMAANFHQGILNCLRSARYLPKHG